jgi:hypothetical protein
MESKTQSQMHVGFSNSITEMRDYVLYTGGARIIHSHTSPTFSSRLQKLRWWMSDQDTDIRLPETAIQPSTYVGECWPMVGSQGQIAIALIAPITMTSITIEHPSRHIAIDIASAPRELELWVQPAGEFCKSGICDPVFITVFTYNIFGSSVQTFATEQSINVSSVLLKIRNNWSNVHHTCLYKIRVHGERLYE